MGRPAVRRGAEVNMDRLLAALKPEMWAGRRDQQFMLNSGLRQKQVRLCVFQDSEAAAAVRTVDWGAEEGGMAVQG